MYKPQNTSLTWTADSEQDIKFNIYRCVFNTGVTGEVLFKNDELVNLTLDNNPIITTDESSIITINHPNHSFETGETVIISGVTEEQNGISEEDINGSHPVTVVDVDNYTIDLGSSVAATVTGITGGSGIYVSRNSIYDLMNITIQNMLFDNTSLSTNIKTIKYGATEIESSYSNISLYSNITFDDSRIIYSSDNELNTEKSLFVNLSLSSSNDSVSPVIDVTRASAILISNRINKELDSSDIADGEIGTSGGSALSKYVTKTIELSESATGIKVFLSAIRPNPADMQVFVKILPAEEDSDINDIEYQQIDYVEYPDFDNDDFNEYSFEIQDLTPFNNFVIKIVMLSSDTSEVPVIRNLRIIAVS
jgi:hypothetical protein